MFPLLRKIRVLHVPIVMQIELFNKLIKPILLYGCEIWAFGNLDIIERVQLKFLKLILNLKNKHRHIWYMVNRMPTSSRSIYKQE